MTKKVENKPSGKRDRHLDMIADVMGNEYVYPLGYSPGSTSDNDRDVPNTPWWYL